jgi:hypothetical protein
LENFDPQLPQPQETDKLIAIMRSVVAGIPYAGGVITEAWSGFFSSPLAKRREAWLHDLAVAVAELQKAMPELSIEVLRQNEAFLPAVLNATSIAIRTHNKEKLVALRNGAMSSVVNPDISEDEQAMFMKYVDDFTPWHLRVLQAFNDPNAHFQSRGLKPWLVERNGSLWSSSKDIVLFMGFAFPELQSELQFRGVVVYDLGVRHLIPITQLFNQKLPDIGPYTTITGKRFMRFIGEP